MRHEKMPAFQSATTMTPTKKSASGVSSSAAPMATPAMLARIEGLLPTMGPAVQRIGEFVIRHPSQVVHMSVSEVAAKTESSEGSVIGFCKMVGTTGFQQIGRAHV